MTDKSHTPELQPPNNRSVNVESVTNISPAADVILGGIVFGVLGVLASVLRGVLGILGVDVGSGVGDIRSSGGVVVVDFLAFLGVGGGVLGIAGGIVLRVLGILAVVILDVLHSVNVGNVAGGVSRLRRALRQMGVAAPFAVAVWIGGQGRRWQAEDWQAALAESRRPIRYSLGLVVAATQMRLYDLGGLLVKAARWVLASNRRTWWPLGSLLTLAAVNIHLSQGWGSAFYTLPTIVSFHVGVEWLRRRWGIELKPKPSAGDPSGDQ